MQTDIRFVEVSRTKLKEASTSILGIGTNFLVEQPEHRLALRSSVLQLPVSLPDIRTSASAAGASSRR